jgi:hypothetical protein
MTALRYAALRETQPKMEAWAEMNRNYWGRR